MVKRILLSDWAKKHKLTPQQARDFRRGRLKQFIKVEQVMQKRFTIPDVAPSMLYAIYKQSKKGIKENSVKEEEAVKAETV